MGGTVLFLLCGLAFTHADIDGFYDNGCPKDTSIKKRLPHPICEQYYQCLRGAIITRLCPIGLLFNPDEEKCDWLVGGNAKCRHKREDDYNTEYPEELDSNNPQHAYSICSKNMSRDILIAHENCNEFYKCSYGKPIVLKCARNLLFNPVNKKCDWPQNVDCSERIVPFNEINYSALKRDSNVLPSLDETDNRNSDPNQAISICATPGSDGVLISHEHCNQYFKCFSGKPVAMKCPLKLLYNPYKLNCDWPRNVDCNERIVPENDNDTSSDDKSNENEDNEIFSGENDNSDPSQAPFICAAVNSDGTFVAHEKCNQYYKCAGGRPVALHCSGNLLFNTNKNYCDWPINVDCSDRNVTDDSENDIDDSDTETTTPGSETMGNNEPNEAPAICKAEGSDGVLVAHENCNQFYKCYNGHPVELTCPGNLLYKPSKEYCDWPTKVDCGERGIVDNEESSNNNNEDSSDNNNIENSGIISNSDPSHARAICAGENSDGILIAHENCNQFYKCFENRPVALFCQLNLVYNPLNGYCDWPRNVDCGNRIIPRENNSNVDPSTACADNPNTSAVAHENCSQFYKCLNGQTYPMYCPPGLYFNTALKVCDWPMNVDCGDRFTETQLLLKEQARNG